MALTLSSTGSYPRVGDSPELQILRRTIALADRGERTSADLADAEKEMTRRAIEEQAKAGIEILTDGQIRWADPISHLAGKLGGVEVHGLQRYFDTNFYFRQPVVKARPARTRQLIVDEYLFARNALGLMPAIKPLGGTLTVKPVLTGPYTLAKFSKSENPEFAGLEERALAFAEALGEEVQALSRAGADVVQIDEPAIVKFPEDFAVFRRAFDALAVAREKPALASRKIQIALYLYFQDCAPLLEKLVDLPIDLLGLDFTYNPKLVDIVAAAGSPVPLALGLVDARNTMLEEPDVVARQVEKMLPRIAGETACLGPSAGLEYLPRDRAFAKLQLLARIRDAVAGQSLMATR